MGVGNSKGSKIAIFLDFYAFFADISKFFYLGFYALFE